MPELRVNGLDLYYEEQGEGPPLLIAHGLMGSVSQMAQYGERLELFAERGVRAIAYDARGHGRSGYTRERSDYTWSAQARDMHGMLRALGLSRASIYGGSMGAGAALALALEQPESIDRLVLRSPPPFDATIRDVLKPFAQLGVLYRLVGSAMAARIVMALPQWRAAQRREPRFDHRRFIASQRAVAIPAAVAALRNGDGLPVARFGEITRPALVLAHPGDALHPLASAELLRDRLPHARLAIAPHARYWADNPAYLAEIVASFVRGELTSAGSERTIVHKHARAGGAR